MSDLKCAEAMLAAAERDFLTLRSMSDEAPEESFGFHLQQATEKALKAWIAARGEQYAAHWDEARHTGGAAVTGS